MFHVGPGNGDGSGVPARIRIAIDGVIGPGILRREVVATRLRELDVIGTIGDVLEDVAALPVSCGGIDNLVRRIDQFDVNAGPPRLAFRLEAVAVKVVPSHAFEQRTLTFAAPSPAAFADSDFAPPGHPIGNVHLQFVGDDPQFVARFRVPGIAGIGHLEEEMLDAAVLGVRRPDSLVQCLFALRHQVQVEVGRSLGERTGVKCEPRLIRRVGWQPCQILHRDRAFPIQRGGEVFAILDFG